MRVRVEGRGSRVRVRVRVGVRAYYFEELKGDGSVVDIGRVDVGEFSGAEEAHVRESPVADRLPRDPYVTCHVGCTADGSRSGMTSTWTSMLTIHRCAGCISTPCAALT